MKVLVVTPWLPTKKKPAAGIFTQRDIELLEKDHEVTVLHLAHPSDLNGNERTPPSVTRQTYDFRSPRSVVRATRKVREMLPSHDLVHTMAMSALLPVALTRTSTPWVHTEHFSDLVNPNLPSSRKILLGSLSSLYRLPNETVAVGVDLATVIDRHRKAPTTVIGNYVRMPRTTRPECARHTNRVNMLAVGGVIARKGPLEAVQALAELHDRGVEATLTWVGEGPLVEDMRLLGNNLSVGDFLRLPGFVNPTDLSNYLLEADLFLLPTEAETFGVVFAEALAHGLPVVTTGVGGHLDFLPALGSRVAPTRKPADLANAVQSLMSAPDTPSRADLMDYARATFSEDARTLAYANVYRAAIS